MNLFFTVYKSPDLIFDYLTDMDKFASIHPVISKIDLLGDNRYLVHETLKLGFFSYSFSYPVTLESNTENKTVTIKATVMKVTHIEMSYSIRHERELSIVDETISIRSFLPLKSIMERIFREQHTRLFQNLDQL